MIRRWFENLLLGSRWLLAPLFVVLIASLLALLVRSVETLYNVGLTVFSASEEILIVEILKLVDLTLTGLLLVIIIVSGFANFIGRIDISSHPDIPQWMTRIDFSGSKLWLLTSVIAISGIRLLDVYINVSGQSDRELLWSAIIYAVFVGHCQSKIYTACSRTRAGESSTVFAHELPPRSAGFDAENRLYLFALTVPIRWPDGGASRSSWRAKKVGVDTATRMLARGDE